MLRLTRFLRPTAWLHFAIISVACAVHGDAAGPERAAVEARGPAPKVPLTRVADIKTSSEFAAESLPVELEGVVTCVAIAGSFFLHDGAMGIHIGESEAGRRVQTGDHVRVRGFTRRGAYAPSIEPREVVALGKGVLPEPQRARFDEVASGTLDGQWLELEGVVCDVEFEAATLGSIFTLVIDNRRLRLTVNDAEGVDPDAFIDAAVRVRGVASGSFNRQRQLVEPVLRVPGMAFMTIVRPRPADAFALPIVPVARLLGFSLEAPSPHRVRIKGHVTRQMSGRTVFLREGNMALKVRTRAPVAFSPGDEIEAVGFPLMAGGAAVLDGAVCRLLGRSTPPLPARPRWTELVDGSHSGDLVQVRARLVDWVAGPDATIIVLQAADRLFQAILAADQPAGAIPDRNSLIEATGICVIGEGDPRWNYAPAPTLLLATPSDLTVVQRPGWWTPVRLWRALAAVLILLAAGLGWVWALRRQVQRKRTVIEQQARHAAMLEERSRIARDLHDTIEQELTGLSLQLKVVEMDCREAPDKVGGGLEAARQMLRRSRALARDAIRELRTDEVAREESLAAGLRRLAEMWRQAGVDSVTVAVEGDEFPLSRDTARNLLAIGTEAVTNAIKHGRASAIRVLLRHQAAGAVYLKIEDDGTGFAVPPGSPPPGGFGLAGMRERAAAIGGQLAIQSKPGAGTIVEVTCETCAVAGSGADKAGRDAAPSGLVR